MKSSNHNIFDMVIKIVNDSTIEGIFVKMKKLSLFTVFLLFCFVCLLQNTAAEQKSKVLFYGNFSPSEGFTKPQEQPYRDDICLNGRWDFQPIQIPSDYKDRTGIAPDLTMPKDSEWESVKIKIPSPWNVNVWGGGYNVGEGTDLPYAPSSVYFPSYPEKWVHARMGWLRRSFAVPENWKNSRILLHFEAVAGECVVMVNGKEAGRNFEQCLPFEVDITNCVDFAKENELLVGVRHCKLFDKKHPLYKYFNATYVPGSNTHDLVGIWQDVFLTSVPLVRVTDIFVKPSVDKNLLEVDVELVNESSRDVRVELDGNVREWINKTGASVLERAEVKWDIGKCVLKVGSNKEFALKSGEKKQFTLTAKVGNSLKYWTPDSPNLYGLILKLKDKKKTFDCKYTRFGWRQFLIKGNKFQLNGKDIQCFGDIQHPFGPYICSRRFAWAWYQMIKDFGGNAVRPHAQPWPRVYCDLADEMGLLVLDETGLFGSSIALNLEEDITWERAKKHLERLVLRDRNHPSVVGWSAGNEMFAIALLNKPDSTVAKKWDDKLIELTKTIPALDPTRNFITLDGDRDMDGRLPVWSKHFAHGLTLDKLPENRNKPLIVGESGATYYGKPRDLYSFVGDKAYESYYGRNEGLAVDVYQNATKMAKPLLSYFSPSEVCWFGLEHLNLGYSDYSRLPNLNDGIFAGSEYQENMPGYQFERIPPYVCTFNPGIDPNLPVYRPLPMFMALQAAMNGYSSEWSSYIPFIPTAKPEFPQSKYHSAFFLGNDKGVLASRLEEIGVSLGSDLDKTNFLIIDAESLSDADIKLLGNINKKIMQQNCLVLVMSTDGILNTALDFLFDGEVKMTSHPATSLVCNDSEWSRYFDLPDLYFAEAATDNQIMHQGMEGKWAENGEIVFSASKVDWTLFNNQPENRKCAQIVLYEHLVKPGEIAMVKNKYGASAIVLSTLNYKIREKEYNDFWRIAFAVMEVNTSDSIIRQNSDRMKKDHDLLMDGPASEK